MISICLGSCYSGPSKFFGCTTPMVKTFFFWFSPDFSGKNSSSADVKVLWRGGDDLDPHFSKRGDCVKKVEDPWVRR